MKFKEFGDPGLPVIILLHGGGLSWWSLVPVIDLLKEKFCITTSTVREKL